MKKAKASLPFHIFYIFRLEENLNVQFHPFQTINGMMNKLRKRNSHRSEWKEGREVRKGGRKGYHHVYNSMKAKARPSGGPSSALCKEFLHKSAFVPHRPHRPHRSPQSKLCFTNNRTSSCFGPVCILNATIVLKH
ncbi:hypothetical protein OCU04_004111 [Sclerotinia nivalis]|uniref:Uncharacterized protein n=1 Tax=Sclerotinia nivalis TaxID=352851 RepID=A0A9X0AT81_9HELO|nr:hypothetical protein OCU04_004111 [Sclerotinia nivalis]